MTAVVTALNAETNRVVVPCAPGTFGRYVTIQKRTADILTLCEVSVYSDCDTYGRDTTSQNAGLAACNTCGDSLRNPNFCQFNSVW